MLKVKKTSRKFYNKWLYKVTIEIPGISIIRHTRFKDIASLDFIRPTNEYLKKIVDNRESIKEFLLFMDTKNKDTWASRIEANSIDIYTNDKQLHTELIDKFKDKIEQAFVPIDETLLSTTDSTVVTKLPHDKYKYKVFLLPHKMKDVDDKQRYVDWCGNQNPKILITDTVKNWFVNTQWNWDRRYVYVEDENTLLMLKLRGADVLGRVHEYRILDK